MYNPEYKQDEKIFSRMGKIKMALCSFVLRQNIFSWSFTIKKGVGSKLAFEATVRGHGESGREGDMEGGYLG